MCTSNAPRTIHQSSSSESIANHLRGKRVSNFWNVIAADREFSSNSLPPRTGIRNETSNTTSNITPNKLDRTPTAERAMDR
jgi:hypothetical protein